MEQLLLKDLAQEIDMLKIQIRDLEIEHKFLMKNMTMNAPKFNGVGIMAWVNIIAILLLQKPALVALK
ncbi:hypothetical protein ACT4UT_39185, partial [Bacillus sp. B-TM1]